MTTNNKISSLVSSQVPFFVRNDHENFIRFLEAYYEFLEQEGGLVDISKNILSYRDIDQSVDIFEQKLYDTFLKNIPEDVIVDKKFLLKHIKDFYRARGSEKSIRFLLSILFGSDSVEFYYPKKDVLRVSDGKWYIQKSLRVSNVYVNNVADDSVQGLNRFVNTKVTGNTSGATATVERVDKFYEKGTGVEEIIITDILGTFQNGEQVFSLYEDTDGSFKSVTANVFGGILNTITVTNGGSNYVVGDYPSVEGGSGTGANVRIERVSTGGLSSISVVEGGAGYQINTFALFSGGGTGSGANAEVTVVLADNSVHPNSYNIAYSTISLEANTNVTNGLINGVYESFAYQNLAIQYTNTSNLKVNTGSGAAVTTINLSGWIANSNVYFETYDSLNVNNTIVLITSTNIRSNVITVNPGLPGNLISNSFIVIKRANANTTIANSLQYFVYANTGPIRTVTVRSTGNNYTSLPTISFVANNRIKELQILGRMVIANSGSGYVVGDTIEFINQPGGYGTGAAGNVTNVGVGGSITEVKFKPVSGQITGGSGYNILPTANVISGTGTGAVITVTERLGEGGEFILANTTLGAVELISVVDRGTGYTSEPTINLRASGDGTATANATILQGVYTYPGRYLNDDGFISSYNFLQDRDYYQNFSYVVRLKQSIANYRKALKELTHPAGAKLFGAYIVEDNSETFTSNSTIDDAVTTAIPVPRLSLDFTTGTLDSNVTFSRASSGTYVNSNGYIVLAGTDVPRFDYHPRNHSPRGLLIEKQSTNLYKYSSNVANPTQWTVGSSLSYFFNVEPNSNTVVAPDGTNTATKFITTANNDGQGLFLRGGTVLSSANTYTSSIYLYVPSQPKLNTWSLFVDFADSVDNKTSETYTIFDEWVRVSHTITTTGTRNFIDYNLRKNTSTNLTSGANGVGVIVYAWGAQLESGNTATSYIPTSSATVTRSADIAVVQGTAFSNVYNQTEGSIVVKTTPYKSNTEDRLIWTIVGAESSSANTIYSVIQQTSNSHTAVIRASSITELTSSSTLKFNNGNDVICGFAFANNNYYNTLNGNSSFTNTTSGTYKMTSNTMTKLALGYNIWGGNASYLNGHIKTLNYYNKRISNSALVQLTTKP